MNETLNSIFRRRAVKLFEPVEISEEVREQMLVAARQAPSSFNTQPYRLYWVQSHTSKTAVAKLCLGQKPAETASALVIAVADLGSLWTTSREQMEWMRRSNFSEQKIRDFERNSKIGRILFMPGPFGIFGAMKRVFFHLLHLRRVIGIPPLSRPELFKWATKSTSLACQNLMIAAEALGINTCPMEGFDKRRLSQYLSLSTRRQEIVMVIAVGRKSRLYEESPQWRRSLNSTVTFL